MTGMQLLALSAEMKEELFPILLFFGMFFVVFGLGGMLIRRLPRKPGSMLDEILSEEWEDEPSTDEPEPQESETQELSDGSCIDGGDETGHTEE